MEWWAGEQKGPDHIDVLYFFLLPFALQGDCNEPCAYVQGHAECLALLKPSRRQKPYLSLMLPRLHKHQPCLTEATNTNAQPHHANSRCHACVSPLLHGESLSPGPSHAGLCEYKGNHCNGSRLLHLATPLLGASHALAHVNHTTMRVVNTTAVARI